MIVVIIVVAVRRRGRWLVRRHRRRRRRGRAPLRAEPPRAAMPEVLVTEVAPNGPIARRGPGHSSNASARRGAIFERVRSISGAGALSAGAARRRRRGAVAQ